MNAQQMSNRDEEKSSGEAQKRIRDARRACDSLLRARTSANWYGREGGIKKKVTYAKEKKRELQLL